MSLNKINLYDNEEFCSLWVSPTYLDYNTYMNKNKKIMKTKDHNDENKDKIISKMLQKKQKRFIDKKYKSNIRRKTIEYSF